MVKKRDTPALDRLFRRIRKQLIPRGSLGMLADKLGVSQPTLSDWLRGRYEPGGEITLQLLKWVEGAETKHKKTPPMLITSTGQKTRSSKSKSNEKAKSDRRKR